MPRRSLSPRTMLVLGTIILLASSLAPVRVTGWITWFRGPFLALVAPVSSPMTSLSAWLRPAANAGRFEDASESELQRQVRELEVLLLAANARVEELEGVIRDISGEMAFERPVKVRRVEATRISANLPAGTFDVNRGRRHGVIGGTVAVARRSEQLVGIVTSTGPVSSTVHVLTDGRLEPSLMVGLVMPDDAAMTAERFATLPRAQFRPTGRGTLLAEAVGADEASGMEVGHVVRLYDDTWASAASMLILGRVSRIEPTDDPLFHRVTVVPLADVARLRSVILFIPEEAPGEGRSGSGGGAG